MRLVILFLFATVAMGMVSRGESPQRATNEGAALVAEYFRVESARLAERSLSEIETLQDWQERKSEYRRQLKEMLGLDPMPAKTELNPVVTGTLKSDGVIVERLHFQSMPGLYVTANLYRPKEQSSPLPAILYVCGHGGEKIDGVSLGNKTHYQHHGAWFARNGYVCLVIDTIQLGEIEGTHHGTYRYKRWWWNNRGYSPAGVEAYNCIRSLDYLQSRSEVDGDRIGVTGRSGGGAYSWWIAAIDDRISVAVPVAGITSLKNHVVDGCVEGHCDCMFMVNTYRWDFPMVAALVAPRPLLISNTDQDRIFPLDGVIDVYRSVRKIYSLYDQADNVGLHITPGPHKDTQELRIAAFRWINHHLRDEDQLIETAAVPLFEKRALKVFETLPPDERVSTIDESFVPMASPRPQVAIGSAPQKDLLRELRDRVFRGWPDQELPLEHAPTKPDQPTVKVTQIRNSPKASNARVIEFLSQRPYVLPLYHFTSPENAAGTTEVTVLDRDSWTHWAPVLADFFPGRFPNTTPAPIRARAFEASLKTQNRAFIVPRGVGETDWGGNERTQTHIRRRFMLLGQTQAGMQIFDVAQALRMIPVVCETEPSSIRINASGEAAFWTLYASLFTDDFHRFQLTDLPARNRDAPDLLNISRVAKLDDVLRAATDLNAVEIRVTETSSKVD